MPTGTADTVYRAYAALVVGILCIAFSAIFVKFADVPGPVSAFYRILIAGMVIIPWWWFRTRRPISPSDILLIAAGGLFFSLDLILWNTSLLLTSAATSTLLANNAPVWVGLASLVLFRERLPARFWLGLVIALAGMSFLVGLDAWRHLQFNRGDLLALGASVFYAAYLLITQHARTRVDTLTFMALSISANFFILLAVNFLFGMNLTGYTYKAWAALMGLGLITHVGGWLCINYALGHLRAAPVSVSLLGQAIVTALLSIPLLGEYLTGTQVIGGVLALTGIYLANQRRRQNNQ